MGENPILDSIDLEILRILQNDARITNRQLAEAVGIAPSTCLGRVSRLRSAGVIERYTLRVNSAALGRPLEALLAVRLQPHRQPYVDAFVEHVLAQPETRTLYHLTGPDDYIIHVAAVDAADLQRFVLNELTSRLEVALVHTNLIFRQWHGKPALPPGAETGTSGAGPGTTRRTHR
ncbi:Lrp/AsnC family transcriptional regulator [Nonomuraea mesophila]|uniref:Lrp/AsnC family transcriptional regulator n=1 Tax=Nonomuraea mesophila TaxID=2530382 RepID=A0A4R5FKZ7_9ACTN|nr:Lrp/AsnC family transcriptional regulator [Nonomuraea mesophila]